MTTSAASWLTESVLYQVYLRSFFDSDGDGVGDLEGLRRKLGYLADVLGVDGVWVTPFFCSPQRDFGYDVSDHCDVDPTFGDLQDFDNLVDTAHELGLRVLIDFIPNHTSADHPWFKESRSSLSSPKRDWYVWRDPLPDGSPPNNWVSETGGSVWEWDVETGQYYLHSFQREMPDLNWRNDELRGAMLDVLRFWLDRGVDGFRIDVANLIAKDPDLRDNPPNPNPAINVNDRQHGDYTTQLHVHDRGHQDLHPFYQEIRELLDQHGDRTGQDRIAIGEVEVLPWASWAEFYGSDLDELHMPFNFGLIESDWTAEGLARSVAGVEAALPEGAWANYVLGNHDRPRLADRLGAAQARVAAVLLLTLRGTPVLYYGDELGTHERPIPPAQWRDPIGRDGLRTPMPWEATVNNGFCEADVQPWLSAWPAADSSVEAQLTDHRSALNLYRELLSLRHEYPCLRTGSYTHMPLEDGPGCFGYVRTDERDQVLVVLNLTSDESALTLPNAFARSTLLLSTHLDRTDPIGRELYLRADEGVIIHGRR